MCYLALNFAYPPSYPFGNPNMDLKVTEQWGMQWSQRGSDDVMTN